MAVNIGYEQLPEFDFRKDPETVYTRFVKYAEWFKNNLQHHRQSTTTVLILRFDRRATLDIVEQL